MPIRRLLFTFGGKTFPEIGTCDYSVELYISNILRCFNCQQFGHGSRNCRRLTYCVKCAEAHSFSECSAFVKNLKCVNCKENHQLSFTKCLIYIQEKEIISIKIKSGLTFQTARDKYMISSHRRFYIKIVSNLPPKINP